MIATEIVDGAFFDTPFPYFVATKGLTEEASKLLLDWFQGDAPWHLVEEEFYEQYEFNLLEETLPEIINPIREQQSIARVKALVESAFNVHLTDKADLTAHKLLPGQTIRLHNDYIPGAETHRVLIQLNRGWTDENGGLLMLFNSENVSDIHRVFRPVCNSCVAFAISPRSFHAVSTIHASERFTLVYSFYES